MYRKFIKVLEQWETEQCKEPLLITGARQVGKTWLIQKFFSETYPDWVYLNFESDPQLQDFFKGSLEPDRLLQSLGAYLGRNLSDSTAIFFDEIQRCEQAITSLKYFCESEKNYRIVGAGSLLGVKLNRFQTSFPVGKVQIRQMYPMDMEEFLLAAGEELLAKEIQAASENRRALPEPLHNRAMQYYRDYLYVGGMPQCIADYADKKRDVTLFNRDLLKFILLSYQADMSKYTSGAAEASKITAVYDSIPRQLAKENPKFKYKEVRAYANRRDFYQPLDWLRSSGMVYQVTKVESPTMPLKMFEEPEHFKIYLSDVGLLSQAAGIVPKDLLPGIHMLFKGALTENYVIQNLAPVMDAFYYYKSNDSMEIDLLMNTASGIVPLEIKAGRNKRSTSLRNYCEKYHPATAIRISANNFGYEDHLLSVPLYAVPFMTDCI